MSQQSIFLKTFNTQFESFLNDINDVFPNNTALIKTRNTLLTLKKFNPKLLIGVWYDYIWLPYKDDILHTLTQVHQYRPDLLAFDLYGTPRLWWVFAQRNPDQIEDPIYDFKPGVTIQLPKPANVSSDFGV